MLLTSPRASLKSYNLHSAHSFCFLQCFCKVTDSLLSSKCFLWIKAKKSPLSIEKKQIQRIIFQELSQLTFVFLKFCHCIRNKPFPFLSNGLTSNCVIIMKDRIKNDCSSHSGSCFPQEFGYQKVLNKHQAPLRCRFFKVKCHHDYCKLWSAFPMI